MIVNTKTIFVEKSVLFLDFIDKRQDFGTLGLKDYWDFCFRVKMQDTRRKTWDFRTRGLLGFWF